MRVQTGPFPVRRLAFTLVVALGIATAAVPAVASAGPSSERTSSTSPVGPEFDSPSGLAVAGQHLWVTNQVGNSVTEIDRSSGSWIRTLHSGSYGTQRPFQQPTAIVSFGSELFVANAAGSVTELEGTGRALGWTIRGAAYGFAGPVAIAGTGSTIVVLNAGDPTASPPVDGSLTEIDAATGDLVARVSGSAFAFDDPVAMTVSGTDVFVADEGNDSVTEVDVTTNSLVRVIANQGLSGPDGIAAQAGHVWVSDSGSNAVTEIAASTGQVIATFTDNDGAYGFGSPSVTIANPGNVFVASPFGSSPMVTKVHGSDGSAQWYMCNTNGPYYFSQLSAFAISGDDLWVASRSGANNPDPDAQTGSLTELLTTTGSLVTTLPTS
jgi:hypothetical protein